VGGCMIDVSQLTEREKRYKRELISRRGFG